MIQPPRTAEWLLEASLPTAEGEAIAGDLWEEFQQHIVPAYGARIGRLWYVWQVCRSLAPLFLRSWERASVTRASVAMLGAAVAATIPATALLSLRSFVLSQVPMKVTPELSLGFFALLVLVIVVTGLLGLAAGLRILQRR